MYQKYYKFATFNSMFPKSTKSLNPPFIHSIKVAPFSDPADNDDDQALSIIPRLKRESPYLVSFFNTHSYLLFFPFRILYSSESGKYVASTSKLRKVLCALLHLGIIPSIFIRGYPTMHVFLYEKRTVGLVFFLSLIIGYIFSTLFIIKISWFNVDNIIRLCNLSSVISNRSVKRQKLTKVLMSSLAVIAIMLCFLHGIFSMARILEAARAFKLLSDGLRPIFQSLGFSPLQWLKSMFGTNLLTYLGLVTFSLFNSFSNVSLSAFLVLPLTMGHLVTCGLVEHLDNLNESHSISKVMYEYERMKDVTKLMREIFGKLVITKYVMIISIFAYMPQVLLIPGTSVLDGLASYGYAFLCAVSFYLSMQINVKTQECLRKYIQSGHHQIIDEDSGVYDNAPILQTQLQLIALRQDVENVPVGVSCYFFTITRNFLRSTIGIVATYALIMLQISH